MPTFEAEAARLQLEAAGVSVETIPAAEQVPGPSLLVPAPEHEESLVVNLMDALKANAIAQDVQPQKWQAFQQADSKLQTDAAA